MEKVNFKDKNLEKAIRKKLGKKHGDITRLDMESITTLWAMDKNISDLTGLEHATNLQEIDMGFNKISNISALSDLTNLQTVRMDDNKISDISALSDLSGLQHLFLGNNQISDTSPLSDLTNLCLLYTSRCV